MATVFEPMRPVPPMTTIFMVFLPYRWLAPLMPESPVRFDPADDALVFRCLFSRRRRRCVDARSLRLDLGVALVVNVDRHRLAGALRLCLVAAFGIGLDPADAAITLVLELLADIGLGHPTRRPPDARRTPVRVSGIGARGRRRGRHIAPGALRIPGVLRASRVARRAQILRAR